MMDDSAYEAWVGRLTLIGDEAFSPGEYVPAEYRRALMPNWRDLSEDERRQAHRVAMIERSQAERWG